MSTAKERLNRIDWHRSVVHLDRKRRLHGTCNVRGAADGWNGGKCARLRPEDLSLDAAKAFYGRRKDRCHGRIRNLTEPRLVATSR